MERKFKVGDRVKFTQDRLKDPFPFNTAHYRGLNKYQVFIVTNVSLSFSGTFQISVVGTENWIDVESNWRETSFELVGPQKINYDALEHL